MIARKIFALGFAFSLLASFAACSDDSVESSSGLEEPLRVKGAQFIEGDLPGTPPAPSDADAGTGGPNDLRITAISSNNRIVLPGQGSKKLDGRASRRASAIAVRMADLGSGYWVFPLASPDPQYPGELTWEAELNFSLLASDTPGFHPVRVVAIDEAGIAGEQSEITLCLASREPDNMSACDPTIAPPDVVVSLLWDAPVDLDLRVTIPGGRTVDPKHPLSDPNADGGAANPDVASITRDSLAMCVEDNRRQEDLVWQKRPQGTIDLYTQLFNACGRPSSNFTMVVYEADGTVPNRHLVERFRKNGRILSVPSGNDSESPPLYVGSYQF